MRIFVGATLLAAFVLSISGCSGSSKTTNDAELPSAFPNHSAEQIISQLRGAPENIQGVFAKTSVKVRSPERNAGFNANISHRRNDSLFMSVRVTFGIEAAKALVTPDSFFVYDRIKKKVYYGHVSNARDHLPIPVGNEGMMNTLLGYELPSPGLRWIVSSDSATYKLTSPDGRESYSIDPTIWRVTEHLISDDDTVQEFRKYSDFVPRDGFLFPENLEFGQPEKNSSASIRIRSLEVNPNDLDFEFNVSSSATRIFVD